MHTKIFVRRKNDNGHKCNDAKKTYKQDLKKGGYLKGDNLCNAEKEKGGSKSTQSLGKLNRWRIGPFFILHSRYFPERKKYPHTED